jgi:hypothetical protein
MHYDGARSMKKQRALSLLAAAIALTAVSYFVYQRWAQPTGAARDEILSLLPLEASAVLFVDLSELRHAPFIASLYAWAPKPQADPDYTQFLKKTGFDYERDLDRIAIAVTKQGSDSILLAIADGKFDRQKISAYALKAGTVAKTAGHEIYSVPLQGSPKKISFTFLRNDRIALTDNSNLGSFLSTKKRKEDADEWRSRFERLAGSPVFAVIRQDAAAGAALAAQAPGGLRSPQLSALLDQLQWITLAGKPEYDRLRIIAEGESTAETTARQLTDLLNGVVILAQAGLNDSRTRQQLDLATREAYLEVLKSADVSKIDRGDTKSVRLVFEITAKFLDASRTTSPLVPGTTPSKPLPGKASAAKKGHT